MSQLNIANFVVLSPKTRLNELPYDRRTREYSYSFPELQYFPLDRPVPLILSRKKCIGLAQIKSMTLSISPKGNPVTVINFTVLDIGSNEQTAFWNLYMLSSGTGNEDDNHDVYIPGSSVEIDPTIDMDSIMGDSMGIPKRSRDVDSFDFPMSGRFDSYYD